MTLLDITLLLITILLGSILATVRSLSLIPEQMSAFELHRRIGKGDKVAKKLQAHLDLLPRLEALRQLIEAVVIISIVIVAIVVLDWLAGAALSVVLVVGATNFSYRSWLHRTTMKHYSAYKPRLLEIIKSWRWLDIFALPRHTTQDVRIASKDELQDLITRADDVLSEDERKRLLGSLSFDEVPIKDVMTPRSMIESVDQRESIGPLVLDQLHKTGHSRFPVIDGDIDHITGMLYLRDLITLDSPHKTVKGAMEKRVYYIREDDDLEHALCAFLRTHHHLFIVVNEFRETVGLLSLEDIIETLLGHEVIDEFDEYHDIRKVAEKNPRKRNQPKGKIDL